MRNPEGKGAGAGGRRAGVAFLFLLSSSALGLLIGLFEASLLWTKPRVIPLLTPDVGYVIWFLAPLADMVFFGLLGLGAGWLAQRTRRRKVVVAAIAGIAGTFVTLIVRWFHPGAALHPFRFEHEVLTPLELFAAGFLLSLLLLTIMTPRHRRLFEAWVQSLLKPLASCLAAAVAIMAVGIGAFILNPPIGGPAAPAASPIPSGAPNIVFITLDTVRADHLSSYGYARPTTPNLDRFARTGVLFENAIAPTSWTLASHASMFTGLLPQQHGADWAVPLEPGPRTVAEILRSRGYQTAGFVANALYLERGWGIAKGFEVYDDFTSSLLHNLSQTLLGNVLFQPVYQNLWSFNWMARRNAADLNRQVFRWLRRRSQRPFFLFINYFDTHDPYLTVAPYNQRFGHMPVELARRLQFAEQDEDFKGEFSAQDRAALIDGYDNCLAYLDNQVGKFLDFIKHLPQGRNTVIIITSDHGEEFGEHGEYTHGYDLRLPVLHVPLIIAGPGVPRGLRISHLVGTRQLFSTILGLAGNRRAPFYRSSLARFWDPNFQPVDSDNAVVSELTPGDNEEGDKEMISLTTPQWEYIEHHSGRQELYDWMKDPREQNDLAALPQEQATLERLHDCLVDMVSNAVGPWRGEIYLQALGISAEASPSMILAPRPYRPGAADARRRIGEAQSSFKPQPSAPARPSQPERDLIQSLPYQ